MDYVHDGAYYLGLPQRDQHFWELYTRVYLVYIDIYIYTLGFRVHSYLKLELIPHPVLRTANEIRLRPY